MPPNEPGAWPGPTRSSKHALLIVDDEPDVVETLRHLFRRQYRVIGADGGAAALELLAREDVAVILSDQRMPGMSGDAFLARAREIRPDSVRMLMTGYADIGAVINAVNRGNIFRYLLKPWDAEELESVVRQAADQYDLLADRRRLVEELRAANAGLLEANRELAEAGELKAAFLEVASHEFNTPITIVLGLSELLRLAGPWPDPDQGEAIDQVAASARHLARLVADTLTVLHGDDFRKTLHVAPVDLADLLRAAVARVGPFIRARGLNLDVDLADDLGEFEVDADKVVDAAVNLLTNAIKFTPDGGSIALHAALAEGDADWAVIRVVDRGIGLADRDVRRLFEPFFTEFDPSRHSSGDFGFGKRGLGLGLAIVKQFVELHGGRVGAESEPGAGTRITIHLPRRPRQDARRKLQSTGGV